MVEPPFDPPAGRRVRRWSAWRVAPIRHGAPRQTRHDRSILGLRLDGVVDDFIGRLPHRGRRRRRGGGRRPAVLVEIDTPGGLGSSMDQITDAFLASDVPVICYVAPSGARAASAGAFILLSCPVAAMAPATNVGASTPIGLDGGDLSNKVRNDAAAKARALAAAVRTRRRDRRERSSPKPRASPPRRRSRRT